MTRKASSQFDSFDPEVIEAARDVANRAGVPLEAWIASVVPAAAGPSERRETSAPRSTAAEEIARSAARETEAAHPVGLTALVSRLDGLDKSMEAERRAEQRRLEEIEARIDRALHANPVQEVTERLGDIERRVAQLGDQVAHTRPPGKRGKIAAEEMREAVQEIRQRQRELSGQTQSEGTVANLHRDIARRLGTEPVPARRPIGLPDYVAEELQREAARLRSVLAQFATAEQVGALETAVEALAQGIAQARPTTDLASIALPVEVIRARIEQLSVDAAGELHAEVAGDIQHFSGRLDVAAAFDDRTSEGTVLRALFAELEEIRALVAGLAGPERIATLIARIQAVGADVAAIHPADEAALQPILDGILTEEKGAHTGVLANEIHSLVERIEALRIHAEAEAAAQARAQAEAQALAEAEARAKAVNELRAELRIKADEAAQAEAEAEAAALAEAQAQALAEADSAAIATAEVGVVTPGDVASIHAMLHSLAEKVDRVGERAGADGLDALERQVLTLADKIEAPHALDPALTSLERTMTDLMAQVEALRVASPNEQLIERATRTAVSETLQAVTMNASSGDIGLLRASLADMQARQIASDERLSSTLEGVQSALDRLVTRLGNAEQVSAPRAPSLDERLLASTSPEATRTIRRESAPEPEVLAVPSSATDSLLEPGAPRPGRISPLPGELREAASDPVIVKKQEIKVSAADGDIKTSFIAAARRAAQAAQAELAAEAPLERHTRSRPAAAAAAAATAPAAGRMARLRAGADQNRRPILLGLAAIVLTLGAIGLRSGDDAASVPQLTQAPDPASQQAAEADKPGEAQKLAETPKAVEPAKDAAKDSGKDLAKATDAPKTAARAGSDPAAAPGAPTAKAPDAAPAKLGLPQASGMPSLAGDLNTVPAGFDKLKQAALAGDGNAVWELAVREGEGRGMPRDLALATKLYEKMANAGYAPAQYKLGAHYEKGTGVGRDLAQAKLWYGRAAEQGHARAMHNLGVIYAENPGAGGKPDFVSAATWFRQGAEHGVRDSQYNIAVLYARGLGLTQDLVQSYAWFAAAAAQGDDDAGKKRDDVATKLGAPDLARAKSLAASFKPRKLDLAVNEPPTFQDGAQGPMSLLGAPLPNTTSFTQPGRKAI